VLPKDSYKAALDAYNEAFAKKQEEDAKNRVKLKLLFVIPPEHRPQQDMDPFEKKY